MYLPESCKDRASALARFANAPPWTAKWNWVGGCEADGFDAGSFAVAAVSFAIVCGAAGCEGGGGGFPQLAPSSAASRGKPSHFVLFFIIFGASETIARTAVL